MKLPNWLKIAWWVLLTIGLIVLLYPRRIAIISGGATPFDIFVFLILVALLLVPLFQEVSFFGISLKQELDELKAHVSSEITGLESEIKNSIDLRTNVSPHFYFSPYGQPPSDAQLPQLEEHVQRILNDTLKSYGIKQPIGESELIEISENVNYLFKVRYNLEKELRRIWTEQIAASDPNARRNQPLPRIIDDLMRRTLIDPELAFVIREVNSVCLPAIHGEAATDQQVRFVRETAPELIASLKAIGSAAGDA